MLKLVKERNKFAKYLSKVLKISAGVERLIYFIFIFFLLCHINACLWYFIGKYDGLTPETWHSIIIIELIIRVVRGGYIDKENVDVKKLIIY